MATSETMSTPNEWMQFYQTNYFSDHINQILPPSSAAADSRSSNLTTPNHGRISKPLRRRARASRRTPTTLFNTDTANFRSMVQRFTGAPVSPFTHASSQPPAAAGLHAANEAATAVNAPDPAAGFYMQYYSHNPLQQQQVFTMDRIQRGGEVVSCHAPPGFSNTKDHQDYSNYMM